MGRPSVVCAALVIALAACGADEQAALPDAPDARRQESRARGAATVDPSRPELARWETAVLDEDHADYDQAQRAFLEAGDPAVTLLVAWLRTAPEDDDRVYAAMDLLPQFGTAAIDGLLGLLEHPSSTVRQRALEVLEALGPAWFRSDRGEDVARAVLALIDDADEDTGDQARTVLTEAPPILSLLTPDIAQRLSEAELPGDESLASSLLSLLYEVGAPGHVDVVSRFLAVEAGDDSDANLSDDAAGVLGQTRPERREQVEALVAIARSGSPDVRERVLEIFREWGDAAVAASPYVISLLDDDDWHVRDAALEALAGMPSAGDGVVSAVIPLHNSSSTVAVIHAFSPAVRRMLPALLAEADAATPERRLAIVRTLHHVEWEWDAPESERIPVASLRTWLTDADPRIRAAAVQLIEYGGFRIADLDAYAELEGPLRDPDASVRLAAATAWVWGMRYDSDAPREPLRPLLRDPSPMVRIVAAGALRDLEVLAAGLSSPDADVRETAAWRLKELDEAAKPAAPAVAAWLDRSEGDEQELAVDTLREIGADDEASVLAFARVLDDLESDAVPDAIRALEALGPRAEAAAPALARVLPNEYWGENAAHALAAIGAAGATDEVLRELERQLRESYDVVDVLEAIAAFGRHAGSAEPAVRAELARDRKPVACLLTLAAIVEDRAAFAAELLALLRSDPDVGTGVHSALIRLGPEGARGLIVACAHDGASEDRFDDAGEALAGFGAVGTKAVLDALADDELHATALRFLSLTARDHWEPQLRAAFADTDAEARRGAAYALESLTPHDFDASPFTGGLIALLPDGGEGAASAARLLGGMHPRPTGAVTALKEALTTELPATRTDAAGALFRITDDVDLALPVLVGVLRLNSWVDDESWNRVGTYLSEMGVRATSAGQAVSAAILRGTGPYAKLVRAIGAIRADGKVAVPALRAVMAGDWGRAFRDLDSVEAAIESARLLGPAAREALPELRDLAAHGPPQFGCIPVEFAEGDDGFRDRVRAAILAVEGK